MFVSVSVCVNVWCVGVWACVRCEHAIYVSYLCVSVLNILCVYKVQYVCMCT